MERQEIIEFIDEILQTVVDKVDKDLHEPTSTMSCNAAAVPFDNSIIKLLIELGAKLDIENRMGKPALHIAVESNCLPTVESLVKCGADLNAKNSVGDAPLHLAALNGFNSVAFLLLKLGAAVDIINRNWYTPLCIAAEKGNKELIQMLYNNNSNINHVTKNGTSVLFIAALNWKLNCYNFLKSLGAVFNPLDVKRAVLMGDTQLINFLWMDNSVNMNLKVRDTNGDMALHWAVKARSYDTVSWLLDKGLKVNAKNRKGQTPLHNAAKNRDFSIVKILVDRGADVNSRDIKGDSPLHYVSLGGHSTRVDKDHVFIVRLLVNRGANVNSKNNKKQTPLHYAASCLDCPNLQIIN